MLFSFFFFVSANWPHFASFFHFSFLYVISFSNVSHSPLLNLQLHHTLPSIMEKTPTTTQESPGSNQRFTASDALSP